MQAKSSISLVLAILLSGLFLFAASPAEAQSRRHRESADSYCHRRANDYARRNSSGGAGQGAARGAALGAIIGAISGNAGRGAAIGAGAGALGGGIRRQESRDRLYRQEYDRCMGRYRY